MPHAANATYYAQIVRDKSTLRSLIHSSTESSATPTTNRYDAARNARAGPRKKSSRSSTTAATGAGRAIHDILHEAMERIDARMKHEHAIGGIETGFTDLDALTGGLHDSELIILAARPSMGKTALALNIAEYVA